MSPWTNPVRPTTSGAERRPTLFQRQADHRNSVSHTEGPPAPVESRGEKKAKKKHKSKSKRTEKKDKSRKKPASAEILKLQPVSPEILAGLPPPPAPPPTEPAPPPPLSRPAPPPPESKPKQEATRTSDDVLPLPPGGSEDSEALPLPPSSSGWSRSKHTPKIRVPQRSKGVGRAGIGGQRPGLPPEQFRQVQDVLARLLDVYGTLDLEIPEGQTAPIKALGHLNEVLSRLQSNLAQAESISKAMAAPMSDVAQKPIKKGVLERLFLHCDPNDPGLDRIGTAEGRAVVKARIAFSEAKEALQVQLERQALVQGYQRLVQKATSDEELGAIGRTFLDEPLVQAAGPSAPALCELRGVVQVQQDLDQEEAKFQARVDGHKAKAKAEETVDLQQQRRDHETLNLVRLSKADRKQTLIDAFARVAPQMEIDESAKVPVRDAAQHFEVALRVNGAFKALLGRVAFEDLEVWMVSATALAEALRAPFNELYLQGYGSEALPGAQQAIDVLREIRQEASTSERRESMVRELVEKKAALLAANAASEEADAAYYEASGAEPRDEALVAERDAARKACDAEAKQVAAELKPLERRLGGLNELMAVDDATFKIACRIFKGVTPEAIEKCLNEVKAVFKGEAGRSFFQATGVLSAHSTIRDELMLCKDGKAFAPLRNVTIISNGVLQTADAVRDVNKQLAKAPKAQPVQVKSASASQSDAASRIASADEAAEPTVGEALHALLSHQVAEYNRANGVRTMNDWLTAAAAPKKKSHKDKHNSA